MIKIGRNIIAEKIQRNLAQASTDLSAVSERLASGQRINHASDDAAGLAISSRLKTDQRLNQQAVRNINDGVSIINIVTSALDSQKGIIERMSELAAQGANSSYSASQRQALQKEYTALLDEFDRIGSTTEFNGIRLLRNQTPQTISLMTGTSGDARSLIEIAGANSHRFAGTVGQRSNVSFGTPEVVNGTDSGLLRNYIGGTEMFNDVANRAPFDQVPGYASVGLTDSTGRSVQLNFYISRFTGDNGNLVSDLTSTAATQSLWYSATASDGETVTNLASIASGGNPIPDSYNFNLSFTSGATASMSLDLSGVTFSSYDVDPSNTKPSAIGFTNVLSEYASRRAVPVLQNRLNELSLIQSQFGAVQSRLSIAHNLRSTQNEVLAAAASRIMDADIATDSAEYVRTSILQQTSAALLAQANQQPALALKLLRV